MVSYSLKRVVLLGDRYSLRGASCAAIRIDSYSLVIFILEARLRCDQVVPASSYG